VSIFEFTDAKESDRLNLSKNAFRLRNPESQTMPDNDTAIGKIIAKAWRDPAFKAELIANPAAALKAEGVDVPDGMAVTVLENSDNQFHLVLPPVPTGELSDEALVVVAAGYCKCARRCYQP
jgi:hypothetical protein